MLLEGAQSRKLRPEGKSGLAHPETVLSLADIVWEQYISSNDK